MKLMVIDGNSIVNRAFYGVRLLSTKEGLYTNGVYGFITILQKLLADEAPEALCVTFDLKAPTFRHEQFAGYKAQRKGMPEELAMQMPILKDVLDAMNIPRYELEGFEADDLIGTIAKKTEDAGWQCLVVTGDKDSFQLITGGTSVKHVKSRMGQTETKLYTPEIFREEYGFDPPLMVDLKALMGDSSDNIPGVPGVGEKTAMDLVQRYGTIENIYRELDTLDIKDGVRKKLAAGQESADMSYSLALIHRDAPIAFTPEGNMRAAFDNDRLYELFKRLEFHKLTERFGLKPPDAPETEPEEFTAEIVSEEIEDEAGIDRMINTLKDAEFAAFYGNGDLSLIVFVEDCSIYILREQSFGARWSDILSRVMTADIKKAGHNIKDIQRQLIARGIGVTGWVFDTALAAYLIDPTANAYDLRRLAEDLCGFRFAEVEDESGQLTLLADTNETVSVMQHAEAVELLKPILEEKLRENGMEKLLSDIELPLCQVLADMENDGILVDRQALIDFGAMLSQSIEILQAEIYAMAGEEFNINSPKQLGVILFERLLLPAPKKTKTGWSTNIDVLEKLRGKHQIVGKIIDYRQLTKLKSTYADGLLKFIGPDGRIHTSFQMTVTATGRLSSTDPNLQNIPVRKELGEELRKMFVAGEGRVLVDADYSQIELRLLAHISGDEGMREAFLKGEDIHRATAARVFGVSPEEVTPTMRSHAKAVNFGIVYGISQFSLSQDIGVSVAEAKRYMDNYFEKYSGIRAYMKDIVEKAKADGYVSTLYGRRRALPELKSSNFNIRSFGERVALNMPIQGTAADIMKIAMINVWRRLRKEKVKGRLLLQIHDELIVECPAEETDIIKRLIKEEMENAASLSIPLTADTSSGKSWYEAK